MSPTLQSGDRILVVRRWPAAWLRRGQIILLRDFLGIQRYAIKRCVGLPGDTLTVHIQATKLDHLDQADSGRHLTVGPGEVFVQGDSPLSIDSRTVGALPIALLVGIAVVRFQGARGGR
jgi:signal peptidase I